MVLFHIGLVICPRAVITTLLESFQNIPPYNHNHISHYLSINLTITIICHKPNTNPKKYIEPMASASIDPSNAMEGLVNCECREIADSSSSNPTQCHPIFLMCYCTTSVIILSTPYSCSYK